MMCVKQYSDVRETLLILYNRMPSWVGTAEIQVLDEAILRKFKGKVASGSTGTSISISFDENTSNETILCQKIGNREHDHCTHPQILVKKFL